MVVEVEGRLEGGGACGDGEAKFEASRRRLRVDSRRKGKGVSPEVITQGDHDNGSVSTHLKAPPL